MTIVANSSLPASACIAMTLGSNGADRIAKIVYDTTDRVTERWSGIGTTLAQQTAQISYNPNGTASWIEDANNNRTAYAYDGHDRSIKTAYPSKTTPHTADAVNDYEQVTYDAGSNILTRRTRRGETLSYTYDNLGQVTRKTVPARSGLASTHTRDVFYSYDLFGALTAARFDSSGGEGVTNGYNGLGQLTLTSTLLDGVERNVWYEYDVAGRRTRITHGDYAYWTYGYDTLGRATHVKDQSDNSLSTKVYGADGTLSVRVGRSAAPDDNYTYDVAKRLTNIFTDHASAAYDVNRGFTYNPAGEIATETIDNASFSWDGFVTSDVDYTANGLNQYTQANANAFTYDANGNLTSDGANTYAYDVENRLVSISGQNTAALRYDPFGRLYEDVDSIGNINRKLYDGDALIAEYNESGTMLQRFIHGLSAGDDPLVTYNGISAAIGNARILNHDRLGSVGMQSDQDGNNVAINTYDEYGVPGASNFGRFQYTGQAWLPEAGLYYYKARMYSPTLGRFLQTDPIGYADGLNLYAYVGNDPVNAVDPTGSCQVFNNYGTMNTTVGSAAPTNGTFLRSVDVIGCGGGTLGANGGLETARAYRAGNGGLAARNRTTALDALGPQKKEPACISLSDGPVFLTGVGADITAVTGGGVSTYKFKIPSIGAEGRVNTGSWLFGAGGGVASEGVTIDTFGQMLGDGYRFEAGIGLIGGQLLFDADGNYIGGGLSYGAAGTTGGLTKTSLKSSNKPICGANQ